MRTGQELHPFDIADNGMTPTRDPAAFIKVMPEENPVTDTLGNGKP